MALRPILQIPDPVLRQVAKPVEAINDELQTVIDDMFETMYEAPGIGLAAPQIGLSRRLVVMDCADKDSEPEPITMINPELTWLSEELTAHEEGCLSIPEYYEEVERPAECKVRFLDRTGETVELEAEGLLAVCIQHEIDHLDGKLFIDYLSRLKRERVTKKFTKAAKRAAAG